MAPKFILRKLEAQHNQYLECIHNDQPRLTVEVMSLTRRSCRRMSLQSPDTELIIFTIIFLDLENE